MLLRISDVTARGQLRLGMDSEDGFADAAPSLPISTTVRSLQPLMGRERRPMGKLLLRVTIRVQTKGCYRVLCLSFRMLLVVGAVLLCLTRACM